MANHPDTSTFAARLRVARERRGLSAAGLSDLAGLGSRAHVGMIERNPEASPTGDTAAKLAAVLEVSLAWLITGEGDSDDVLSKPKTQARRRRTGT